MSASQHAGVSLKSNELWPALRDHTYVNPLTPGSWQGARDADRCCLKNLVLGQTFEEFEAGHISVLESLLWLQREGWNEGIYKCGQGQPLPEFTEEQRRDAIEKLFRRQQSQL